MRVAACQLPEVRDDIPGATALICEFAARAEHSGVQLVCFPECFLQGYFTDAESVERLAMDIESPEFAAWLRRVRTLRAVLVLGLIERSGNDFFNTAVAIRQGALVCRYRKIHLLEGEKSVFRAGPAPSVFAVDGVKVGLAICYDLNFAATIQANVRSGARLLACPCNNMLSRATAERLKHAHNAIRCERAKESGAWLLTADVTGQSDDRISYGPTALIRPDGRVADQVPLKQTGMIVRDLE